MRSESLSFFDSGILIYVAGEYPAGYPRYVGEGRRIEKGLPMIVKCRRLEYMGYAIRSDGHGLPS